ncbi:MAG: hypothetical protein ACLRFI_02380 [Alphaproteobacteria bacterium]
MKGVKQILYICLAQFILQNAGAITTDTNQRISDRSVVQNSSTQSRVGHATNQSVRKTIQSQKTQQKSNKPTIANRTSSKKVISRNSDSSKITRGAVQPRSATIINNIEKANKSVASRRTNTREKTISRAAETNTVMTRENVMSRNFSKCRQTFVDCMDEFCANKDTELKRCACSAKYSEYYAKQNKLNEIDDKFLDFNQRLLTVSMSPEDAAVINTATIGEEAYFDTTDKSASKKALDKIASKLNSSFNSSNFDVSQSFTWSLNSDSAFDSVDSLSGSSISAKSGTALYSASLPLCQEIAAEFCTPDDLSLAESGYKMMIEQDCSTLSKTLNSQINQAQNRVLESGALLDMSRLNVYQENNSDDLLTCKAKMLDILNNTSVCGTDLIKCLDTTGQYIDISSGKAFLTPNLVNLSLLLTRPTNGEKWSNLPSNSSFVHYLNTKKDYITSATKNCQEMSEDIWNIFIEEALPQIKLAQDKKLQEIRESCTSLMSDCITQSKDRLSNFDSRALSTFGIQTDNTVRSFCQEVNESCANVLSLQDNANNQWVAGITEIQAADSYETIVQTCKEIGQNCIIQSCQSRNGNFGLCETNTSVYRHSILSHSDASCWQQVLDCVSSSGSLEPVQNYLTEIGKYDNNNNFYSFLYGSQPGESPCDINDSFACRLAESIWGNCTKSAIDKTEDNIILKPKDTNYSTLLSWFGESTNNESCTANKCPTGQTEYLYGNEIKCSTDVITCPDQNPINCQSKFVIDSNITNCCPTELYDSSYNCCMNKIVSITDDYNFLSNTINICVPNNTTAAHLVGINANTSTNPSTNYGEMLVCLGNVSSSVINQITCDGSYLKITYNNTTMSYEFLNDSNTNIVNQYYIEKKTTDSDYCNAYYNNKSTKDKDSTKANYFIEYK